MVFNFIVDDDFLNSPPYFSPTPSVASPQACYGCIGVISRFDGLQLRVRLDGGGAVEEAPEESPRARDAKKQVKEVSLLGKAVEVLDAIGCSVTNLNKSSSFMSRSTIKEKIISVLAFEVANTITKGANLMQSLTEQNIGYLKEEVLPSEGVQYLVSTDMDELLRIAAADFRNGLQLFTKEVVWLGNQCKDPQFFQLDRYFHMMESRLAFGTPLRKDMWAVMLPLINMVQPTAELYHKISALDRYEQDYGRKLEELTSLDAKDKNQPLSAEVRADESEEACEKFTEEITLVKDSGRDFERAAGGSASNHRKLGSSLALHYANIISLIDTIVAHSGSVTPTMSDALYQSLPPGIESALRSRLREAQIHEEPTIPSIKAKMEKTLSWLAPFAASTIKAHYGFARLGEWANMRVNQRPSGKGDFIRINTLYHADKEKTDNYIVELLFWLHQLVCKRRAMNNGVACSLDSTVSTDEIKLSSHCSRTDVYKRKLMRGTSGTLESKTENLYSCHYHQPCTGVCDSLTSRSPGVSVLTLKTLSMEFGIDMMTTLDAIDGIPAP